MFTVPTTLRISFFTTLCLALHTTGKAADAYAPRVEYGARLEPGNRIIHGAGQDAKGFSDYAKCFDGDHQPLIYMTYLSLRKPAAEIMAWGTRLERELAELGPAQPIPQIGLNLTGGKDDGSNLDVEISEGKFDAHIVAFADALASLARPVFIRIGYEFDGKWNNYQPATFQASWKRITRMLRERNLPFATVWCTAGRSSGSTTMARLMEFYPGDECVDWWGVDIFSAKELTHPQLEDFLDASGKHRKPVMIGEMTPRHVGVHQGQESWDTWFGPMIDLLKRRPEIKATAYINWEWREQSDRLGFQWHNWGDARIEGNALVRDRWVKELSDPIYLHAPRDGSFPLSPVDMQQRAQELKNLKWGMFICWSFSTFSEKEWTPGITDLSFFRATHVDTDQWARTAKEAGMGYILFLAKHHDGFCLWDTQTTDRKVTRAPLGRDVLAELKKSCDKHGIKLALYFSEGEWRHPGGRDHPDTPGPRRGTQGGRDPAMKKAQLRELLTQYGSIEYIWFDHAVGNGGLSHAETLAFCKALQPGCFIGFNHGDQAGADIRLGEEGKPGSLHDHSAAGRHMKDAPSKNYLLAEFTYPIQPERPKGAKWFYSHPDNEGVCHSTEKLYSDYLGAVKFGNIFSIDVGPDYEGKLRDIDVKTLREVGRMIRAGGESPPRVEPKETRAADHPGN